MTIAVGIIGIVAAVIAYQIGNGVGYWQGYVDGRNRR